MGFFGSGASWVDTQNDGGEMVVQTGLPKNCKFFGKKRITVDKVTIHTF